MNDTLDNEKFLALNMTPEVIDQLAKRYPLFSTTKSKARPVDESIPTYIPSEDLSYLLENVGCCICENATQPVIILDVQKTDSVDIYGSLTHLGFFQKIDVVRIEQSYLAAIPISKNGIEMMIQYTI